MFLTAPLTTDCPICLGPPQYPVTSRCCQIVYCKACLEESLNSYPNCPTCRTVLRRGAMGNQPPGTMSVQVSRQSSSTCGPTYVIYNSVSKPVCLAMVVVDLLLSRTTFLMGGRDLSTLVLDSTTMGHRERPIYLITRKEEKS